MFLSKVGISINTQAGICSYRYMYTSCTSEQRHWLRYSFLSQHCLLCLPHIWWHFTTKEKVVKVCLFVSLSTQNVMWCYLIVFKVYGSAIEERSPPLFGARWVHVCCQCIVDILCCVLVEVARPDTLPVPDQNLGTCPTTSLRMSAPALPQHSMSMYCQHTYIFLSCEQN